MREKRAAENFSAKKSKRRGRLEKLKKELNELRIFGKEKDIPRILEIAESLLILGEPKLNLFRCCLKGARINLKDLSKSNLSMANFEGAILKNVKTQGCAHVNGH